MIRISIALMLVLGCGGGGSSDDDDDGGPLTDADPFKPDADPFKPDASPPGTPDAAPIAAFPTCYPTCTTAADCVQGTSTLFDVDNYACDDGTCRWLGCNSTGECTSAFMNPNYACALLAPLTFSNCWPTCSSVSDCVLGTSTLYDTDNYECTGGKCRFTGCNNTGECTNAFMNPNYTCYNGGCWPTCSVVSDCVLTGSLYGADNYECNGGRCEWQGCNSTSECTDTFMSPDYVCSE